MAKLNKLSAIIITRNEEIDLPDCLKSLEGLADEIILVDSGSTDGTLALARAAGAQIFEKKWEGFSAQKQFALSKSNHDWVLNIDADERVSPGLKDEINGFLSNPNELTSVSGINIPFHHYFLGTRLRFGSGMRERHIRLFKKSDSSYGQDSIHEGIQVKGAIGSFNGVVNHYSYRTIEEYLDKCNIYTSLIAEKKFNQGKRFSFFCHLRLPYEFIVRYFIKLGFLDGKPGLTYALLSSYYVWLKFVKIQDYQKENIKCHSD